MMIVMALIAMVEERTREEAKMMLREETSSASTVIRLTSVTQLCTLI